MWTKRTNNCHWNKSSFVTCDVIFAENGMFCTPHWNKNSWTKRRKLWRLVFVIITTTVFLPLDMIMKLFSIGCSPYVRLYPLGCAASSLEYYSRVFIQSCFSWLVLSSSMKSAWGPQIDSATSRPAISSSHHSKCRMVEVESQHFLSCKQWSGAFAKQLHQNVQFFLLLDILKKKKAMLYDVYVLR